MSVESLFASNFSSSDPFLHSFSVGWLLSTAFLFEVTELALHDINKYFCVEYNLTVTTLQTDDEPTVAQAHSTKFV